MRWFVILILASCSVQAASYKCKSASGKTTYQQSPCRPIDAVKEYKYREESEATKHSLEKARKVTEEKRVAKAKQDKENARIAYEQRLRHNNERVSAARANFEEAKVNNARAVTSINKGNAERGRIRNDYLRKVLR